MSAPNSRFVRACRCEPVDTTPIWLMRQAGRYMAEYRAVRKHHSILEICKKPELAAEVTITAAEKLGVDAAIIFADLLLPLEVMGLPFHFSAGEGPVIEQPLRSRVSVEALDTSRSAELGYVAESIAKVVRHFGSRLPVIGFCGAPFTLASYMIEGGGSRNYIHTKKMMYTEPATWNVLMNKLVEVLAAYSLDQVKAGADALQIFDSWVGCLSIEDYRRYVLPHARKLVQSLAKTGVPIIYFGTDTATLLPSMKETEATVIGVDWRIPLDRAWESLKFCGAIQGNLDPVLLFAGQEELRSRASEIMAQAGGRPGHIFNLGHGILPETPVENVLALINFVRIERQVFQLWSCPMTAEKSAVLLLAHGSPDSPSEIPEFLRYVTGGRPFPEAAVEEIRHRYSLVGRSPLTELTLAQGEALRRHLGLPVYVGMRNWKPFIGDVVREIAEEGVQQVLAICLAPQNSSTSVGLYKRALFSHLKPGISIQFVEEWHDHPMLVQAFAEKLEPLWRSTSKELGSSVPVIFTAHSVPTRTIQAGDPYERQAKETAQLVGNKISGLTSDLQHFAFQSQGMSGGPWLGPTVERVILDLKKQGHRGFVVVPIGFLCDHIEVLYDIDINFKTFASEQGMKLWRTESLNSSPQLISALAHLASEKLSIVSGRNA